MDSSVSNNKNYYQFSIDVLSVNVVPVQVKTINSTLNALLTDTNFTVKNVQLYIKSISPIGILKL